MEQLKCKNCGAPMQLMPGGTSAKCPVCGTEAVVATARSVNAAIAAKGDISGVMEYRLDDRGINDTLCNLFHEYSSSINPSVFKDIRIVEIEKCCASAFLFECEWQSNYSCEVATEKIVTKVQSSLFDNARIETREETRTEWQPQTGAVSGSCNILACSSQEIADGMNAVWGGLNVDIGKLVDIESAEFPPDLQSFRENLTSSAVFEKYGRRQIDVAVQDAVQTQFQGRACRNFNLGNPMIRKNVNRILLTCARVTAEYNGEFIEVWIGNNRAFTYQSELLEDSARSARYTELSGKLKETKDMSEKGCLGCLGGLVVSGVLGLMAENMALDGSSQEVLKTIAGFAALAVFIGVWLWGKSRKNAAVAEAERAMNNFKNEAERAYRQFRQAGGWLVGLGPTNLDNR